MKLKILAKMMLLILTPALLGLGVVAGLSYREAETALVMQVRADMELLVERQQSELAIATQLLHDALRFTGASVSMMNYARAHAEKGSAESELELSRNAAVTQLATVVKNFPLIAEVSFVDAKGIVVLHTNPKGTIGSSRADRAYFKAAMQGKDSAENLKSRTTGELSTIMASPIIYKGTPLGILFARLDTTTLNKNITDKIRVGKTGMCFVIDNTGTIILHNNKSLLGQDMSKTDWGRVVLEKKNGRVMYLWNGVQKVAYFRNMPDVQWNVIISVEYDEMVAPAAAMLRSNAIIGGICALIVGLIIFFVAKSIAGALRGCAGVVAQVAEGNTSLSPEQEREISVISTRSDELGSLGRGIGRMVENIRRLFGESEQKNAEALSATEEARTAMKEAEEARTAAERAKRDGMLAAAGKLEGIVAVVSSASEQLSAQIAESERGAGEQATRITETATAMEEMNSTVLEVARNAGQASEVSTATRQKAESGAKVVQRAVASIQEVQQQSLALKEDMGALGQNAQAISQIMGVISDIADQTNLLALNAAIEAARAGDAGRGFAVVADEVRKLAEKTMQSTTDVGNAIKAIQVSADKSMRQVDEAVKTIEQATELAEESGTALAEIVSMVDNTADQVRAIATASEEQSATTEEINRSVVKVNAIAGETSRAMQEAASAVNELASQSQTLGRLIEEMKNS